MSVNREALIRVALTLKPLLGELVFVGGRVVEHYLTSPVSPRPRPTKDTDAVCLVGKYSEYHALGEQLEKLGLRHDTSEGAHMCRWKSDTDTIDILPVDPSKFGFHSHWYEYGVETAMQVELAEGILIRIFMPTVFVADKLDAHEDRGGADPRASHDLEDIINIVAGRPSIAEEYRAEIPELRAWVARQVKELFGGDFGEEIIESHLPRTSDRATLLAEVSARLEEIANDPSGS